MSRWEPLLAVQELDTHLDQLAHRLRMLPARATLATLEDKIAGLDRQLVDVDGRHNLLDREQRRLEDEIASLRARAGQADKQLYSGATNNPRELQALQDDIASIQRRISSLEDEELDVMEALEPVDAERVGLVGQRDVLDDQAKTLRAEVAEAEAEIEAEVATVRSNRDAIASDVDDGLWSEYDSLRSRLGGIAIARLVGSTCQGCHLQLSAVEVDRIRRLSPDDLVHCEECGRLLVRS
ncbi:MAG TPA: C4-type zinc ribbon domain-containing protein [Acidimicrobiales bacterium]